MIVFLKGEGVKEFVWKFMTDLKRFPQLMPDLIKVNILEKGPREGKTEMALALNDFPLTVVNRIRHDSDKHVFYFEAVEGDFKSLIGIGQLTDCEGGLKIYFHMNFDLGLPGILEDFYRGILKEMIRTNLDFLVTGLKDDLLDIEIESRR